MTLGPLPRLAAVQFTVSSRFVRFPPDKLVRLSVAINIVRALASGLPRTVVKVKLIKRISCGASSCGGHNPALCKADLHKIPVAHEAAS